MLVLLKKIVSVVMALMMNITATVPSFSENISNPGDYAGAVAEEGHPVITTEQFCTVVDGFTRILSFIGGEEPDSRSFNITLDEYTTQLSAYICGKSGLDIEKILKGLPDISRLPELATDALSVDTAALREALYEKRDECYAADDHSMGVIYHFLGAYFGIIREFKVYAVKISEDPPISEIRAMIVFKDGGTEDFSPGVFINEETGECTNKADDGLFGSGYNFSLADMVLYATVNCWMRDYGFCLAYDVMASTMPVFFNYTTRRFKFDYDGLEWMIQAWKGNYLIANGGEVGLYHREEERSGTFYDSADDDRMLDMSMQIYHGEELLVSKPMQKHWWINGFNLGKTLYIPQTLTMNFSVVMPDGEMLAAFCEAIDNHPLGDVSYTVDGLTVNVLW